MNDNFIITKLLSNEDIKSIQDLLKVSNENNFWKNGLESGGKPKTKNNLELFNEDILKKIHLIILNKLNEDQRFHHFTLPKSVNLNIVSKMENGGFYNPHFDRYGNGDFSTTVFLNDPNDYEGGELCLYINDEEKKIKLGAGYAVTYPTGILHRINKVISGVRYVSVFWTCSEIQDEFMRSICLELKKIRFILKSKLTDSEESSSTCEEASNNPVFLINNLEQIILRKFYS